jgi:hypothetical protein
MDPLTDNDDWKRDAPHLAGLPKADPFSVPDGFFDRFPHQVQAAIVAQEQTTTSAQPWWKRLSIALPIVALMGLAVWMLMRDTPVAEVPAVAVTPLTDGELDAMDDHELLAAFDETDAEEITPEDLGGVVIDLNDDELLAYLEHEDTDLADLITDIE